jgi:rhodanese-related sulfurtransferase
VCRTDKRSAKAASVLRAAAIQNVFVLRGGVEEWNRSVSTFDLDQRTAA